MPSDERAALYAAVDHCPLCGGRELVARHRLRYANEDARSFLSDDEYAALVSTECRLCQCRGCGFFLTSPRPTPSFLARLYGQVSAGYYEPLGESSEDRGRLYEKVRRLLSARGSRGGRLLDIGCGTGQALAALSRGFEVFGVEPSRFAAERAREAAGAKVHVGDLESARYPDGFFDAITAFDVIEHLADPRRMLAEVRRILRPGGTLVIETGDIGSLNARLAAGHWYYVLLPGHISFFSRKTLSRLLAEMGYQTVRSQRTHHGMLDLPVVGRQMKALARHLLARSAGERILALPFFRSRTMQYRIPFFYDHMLVAASRAAEGHAPAAAPTSATGRVAGGHRLSLRRPSGRHGHGMLGERRG